MNPGASGAVVVGAEHGAGVGMHAAKNALDSLHHASFGDDVAVDEHAGSARGPRWPRGCGPRPVRLSRGPADAGRAWNSSATDCHSLRSAPSAAMSSSVVAARSRNGVEHASQHGHVAMERHDDGGDGRHEVSRRHCRSYRPLQRRRRSWTEAGPSGGRRDNACNAVVGRTSRGLSPSARPRPRRWASASATSAWEVRGFRCRRGTNVGLQLDFEARLRPHHCGIRTARDDNRSAGPNHPAPCRRTPGPRPLGVDVARHGRRVRHWPALWRWWRTTDPRGRVGGRSQEWQRAPSHSTRREIATVDRRRRAGRTHGGLSDGQDGMARHGPRSRRHARRHLAYGAVQGLPLRHRRPPVLHQDCPGRGPVARDPREDEFISVPRLSRIHYNGTFFDYPAQGRQRAGRARTDQRGAHLRQLPVVALQAPTRSKRTSSSGSRTASASGCSKSSSRPTPRRCGAFPCTEIRAEWAAQRIQGLSLAKAILNATALNRRSNDIKSLINEFQYPRLGPGQMWETCGGADPGDGRPGVDEALRHGDRAQATAGSWPCGPRPPRASGASRPNTSSRPCRCDRSCARSIRSRRRTSVADAEGLKLPRLPGRRPDAADREDLFPDNWIYIHTPGVKVGRIQNFNNWSKAMVPEAGHHLPGHGVLLLQGRRPVGQQRRRTWWRRRRANSSSSVWPRPSDVKDGAVIRMPKAYPIYDSKYRGHLDGVRAYIDPIANHPHRRPQRHAQVQQPGPLHAHGHDGHA